MYNQEFNENVIDHFMSPRTPEPYRTLTRLDQAEIRIVVIP